MERKKGCKLCPRLLRVTKLNNDQLIKELSTFCPLPHLKARGDEFLSIGECQTLLENGTLLKEELGDLRRIWKEHKEDDKDSNLAQKKARDSKLRNGVNWSKVCGLATCGDCGLYHYLFSHFTKTSAKGPQKKHFYAYNKMISNNRYRCGDLV